jgi:hypothetical protein
MDHHTLRHGWGDTNMLDATLEKEIAKEKRTSLPEQMTVGKKRSLKLMTQPLALKSVSLIFLFRREAQIDGAI